MNYDLNKEQTILKKSARDFLSKECPSEFVREMAENEKGISKEIWQKMAGLDWMGLIIPEQYEGLGFGILDLVVLLSEMGYFCLPGPYFTSAVLSTLTIMEGGSDQQKKDLLPGLAKGEKIFTLAWIEEDVDCSPESINLVAEKQGDKYLLSGTKLFVPDANMADTIICAARTSDNENEISLFLIDANASGIQIHPLNTLAGDKQCEVIFDSVAVSHSNLLGLPGQGEDVLNNVLLMAAVAKCGEMNGGARKVMDLAIPYVKGREQFGRPVGAFQAIQHKCSDMLTYADTIHFMTCEAAWRIDAGLSFKKEASMCKAWVSDAYRELVAMGHQVIGGLGFMEEYDLQLYFKRAKAAEQMFGDADYHREMVANELEL